MKKILYAFSFLLAVAACGPSRHAVHVEMRYPSKSGIELAGKNISVVYLENDNPMSSFFAEGLADGFAYSLEQDYQTGEGSIGVYRMRCMPGGEYSSRDSLFNLLIDTGADVVFLVDTLSVGKLTMGGATHVASATSRDSSYLTTGQMPFRMKLYCFDGMNKDEDIYVFNGGRTAATHVYSDGMMSPQALEEAAVRSLAEAGFDAGRTMSRSFRSQWKQEQYSLVYFDGAQWYKGIDYAEQYYWKEAMDVWIGLLDTNDLLKRSCAEYNIAVACYMLGDIKLASEWLDRSDADNRLPLSDSLRKRIDFRLNS